MVDGEVNSERGLDRCLRTVYATCIALRDCGESDDDITKALKAILDYGPREALDKFSEQDAASVIMPVSHLKESKA